MLLQWLALFIHRRAPRWSAGSCSVTLGSWREEAVSSWRYAPDCGLKPLWRWDCRTLQYCSVLLVKCRVISHNIKCTRSCHSWPTLNSSCVDHNGINVVADRCFKYKNHRLDEKPNTKLQYNLCCYTALCWRSLIITNSLSQLHTTVLNNYLLYYLITTLYYTT